MRDERLRDVVDERPAEQYWDQRSSEGWSLAAIEWKREAASEEGASHREEVPFGLRASDDCHSLEEDPSEMAVLRTMMDLIVDDQPISKVTHVLNERGFRTRQGNRWTKPEVFQMLPRLIDVGPRIFSGKEWQHRRGRLMRVV